MSTLIQIKRHLTGTLDGTTTLKAGEPFIDLSNANKKLYIGDGNTSLATLKAINSKDVIIDVLNEEGSSEKKIDTKSLDLSNVSEDNKSSSTKPVYVDSNGHFQPAEEYAGGTNISLNGIAKSGQIASIYAPTTAGSKYQIPFSVGASTPSWGYMNLNLNGTTTTLNPGATTPTAIYAPSTAAQNASKYTSIVASDTDGQAQWVAPIINGKNGLQSFYAPLDSGNAGQILVSNGNNKSPQWKLGYIDTSELDWDAIIDSSKLGTLWIINKNEKYKYKDELSKVFDKDKLFSKCQSLFQSYGTGIYQIHGKLHDGSSYSDSYVGYVNIWKYEGKYGSNEYYIFDMQEFFIDSTLMIPNKHHISLKKSVSEDTEWYSIETSRIYEDNTHDYIQRVYLSINSTYSGTGKTPSVTQIEIEKMP